ncbi:MAG: hypothetical protein FIB01_00855 [Gemmatimonadetes bacterium]|nr:hypothetical protein [Gemmatimonadota bacterium]
MNAGSYTFAESDVAGYTEGTWSCTGATASGTAYNAGSVTVPNGGAVVCTITNNDIAPSLTLIKVVVNSYGGTRVASDWTLTANGGGAGSISGTTPVTSGAGFKAGTYALSESGSYAGYENGTSYSCVKNGGAPTSTSSIALAVGDAATCTITNHDLPAKIRIVKSVKGASSTFSFNATGTGLSAFTITPPANSADSVSYGSLSAGAYSVSELIPSGYTLTGLECSAGGTTDYPAGSTASITLAPGDSVRCAFENTQNSQVTRTQGFWATHLAITQAVWFGGSVGGHTWPGLANQTLCTDPLDTTGKVLGGFWSNISRTTTNTRRSDLDQVRLQLLQQLLAAILNHEAFGSSPSGPISIAEATSRYCGTDVTKIKEAIGAMGSFNTSGDSGLFTPGVSANGKQARDAADLVFWNILPH